MSESQGDFLRLAKEVLDQAATAAQKRAQETIPRVGGRLVFTVGELLEYAQAAALIALAEELQASRLNL